MGAKFQEATSKLLDVMRRAWLKKHGVPLPAPTMTAQQRAEIQECFEMLDSDGSGALDVKEILHAFGALGFTISKDAMSELMSEADPDGSGELEFDEFLSLMGRALYQPDDSGVTLVAKTGSGDLSFADVVRAFRRKKLIESLIRGGDARLKVVEFHERVQDLIRAETETLRQRENAHAIYERVENSKAEKAEREKMKQVKSKMRDAIGRSLGAFEDLYRRHQGSGKQHHTAQEAGDLAAAADNDEGSCGGSGARGDVSGCSRASSPGLARGITFLTELKRESSGASLPGLPAGHQVATRRPRPRSATSRRQSRPVSTLVLSKAQSRKVSAAVLRYFKHLEEQAKRVEQKYDDAARLNASLIPPPPDRSEFSLVLQQSSRPTTSRFSQGTGSANFAATANTSLSGAATSLSGAGGGGCGGGGSRETPRMSLYAAATTLATGGGRRSPSARLSPVHARGSNVVMTRASDDGSSGGSGYAHSPRDGRDGPRSTLTHPPQPQHQHQHQQQRLLCDGSEVGPYPTSAGQDSLLGPLAPTTAAWAEFMAAAAAVSSGSSLGSGGGGAGGHSPPAPPSANTSSMANRTWRQTPSFGPAGGAVSPVGWCAGGGAAASSRTSSARALQVKRPSSGCAVVLPPVSLNPSAITSSDAPYGSSSRCASPMHGHPLQNRAATSGCGGGGAGFSVTTWASQSNAGAPTSPEAMPQDCPWPATATDPPASRSNFMGSGLASAGSAASGLGTPALGPMARALLAHTHSMPPGGITIGGGGGGGGPPRGLRPTVAPQSARRQASVSANGTVSQNAPTGGGGDSGGSGGGGGGGGGGAVKSPGYGQRPLHPTASRGPGPAAATAATATAGSIFVPSPPSQSQFREMSRYTKMGSKYIPPEMDLNVSGGVSSYVHFRDTGGSGSGDMLLPGTSAAVVWRAAGFNDWRSDSDGGGSRGHTGDGYPSSGDGGGSYLRTGRMPTATGRSHAVSAAVAPSTAAAGSSAVATATPEGVAAAEAAEAAIAVDSSDADVAAVFQVSASSRGAGAVADGRLLLPPSQQSSAATVPYPDPATEPVADATAFAAVAGADATASAAAAAVATVATAAPAQTGSQRASGGTPISLASKINGRDSIQSSAPSGSLPPSPRCVSSLNPHTNFDSNPAAASLDTTAGTPAAAATPPQTSSPRRRNSSVDGDSYPYGQMVSPTSAAAVATAAAAVASGMPSHSTYSVSGGVAVVTSNPNGPPPPPPATNGMPVLSPMRNRVGSGTGAAAATAATAVSVPASAYAPRGAYLSLQLASQRSAGAGGVQGGRSAWRSVTAVEGSGGSGGGSPARPPAAPKNPASADSPPATRPPLQDRVVVTFFGQPLPRGRNGAVTLPAMAPPSPSPPSYPPELQQLHNLATGPGISPRARSTTPLHTRPWQNGITQPQQSTPPAMSGNGGSASALAATAAAASAWLTSSGGSPGWPPAAPPTPPAYLPVVAAAAAATTPSGSAPSEFRRSLSSLAPPHQEARRSLSSSLPTPRGTAAPWPPPPPLPLQPL